MNQALGHDAFPPTSTATFDRETEFVMLRGDEPVGRSWISWSQDEPLWVVHEQVEVIPRDEVRFMASTAFGDPAWYLRLAHDP